jgi:hypothetical protein
MMTDNCTLTNVLIDFSSHARDKQRLQDAVVNVHQFFHQFYANVCCSQHCQIA